MEKILRKMLKEIKTESTYTLYGEGFKAGKIDIIRYLLHAGNYTA